MKDFTEGAVTAGLTPSLLAWGPAGPRGLTPRAVHGALRQRLRLVWQHSASREHLQAGTTPLRQSPEWASEDPPRSHRATSRADHQPHWLPRPGLSVQGSLPACPLWSLQPVGAGARASHQQLPSLPCPGGTPVPAAFVSSCLGASVGQEAPPRPMPTVCLHLHERTHLGAQVFWDEADCRKQGAYVRAGQTWNHMWAACSHQGGSPMCTLEVHMGREREG